MPKTIHLRGHKISSSQDNIPLCIIFFQILMMIILCSISYYCTMYSTRYRLHVHPLRFPVFQRPFLLLRRPSSEIRHPRLPAVTMRFLLPRGGAVPYPIRSKVLQASQPPFPLLHECVLSCFRFHHSDIHFPSDL